ncbi:MAG: tetratricopeptide repeat protein [candidate division Zixibacteria bacterium]|nr:tetratricopeptide repeat protein [candidate division Zixibacteria bacterium]
MDAQTAESLLNFAEEAGPSLRGPESKALFEQFDQKYGDLQSALQWYIDEERATESFRLASALVAFWMATKRMEEGCVWFDRALALPGGEDVQRGRASFDAGYLTFWRGDYERSWLLQNRALELGRRTNNPTVTALALVGLARIALFTDVEEARKLCREAIAVTEGTADRAGRSSAMHVLGAAAQMAGDFLEARDIMSQRIALGREMGNLAIVSIECNNLSMVERQLGNLDRAEALAREALEIDYQRGNAQSIPWMVNGLAAVARDRGEFKHAATLIGIADAAMEAAGGAWPPDELVHYQRTVATITEAMGSAQFERARAAGRSMTLPKAVNFALGTRSAGS